MRRSPETVRPPRRPPVKAARPAVGVTIADRQRRVKLDRRWLEGVVRRAVVVLGPPAAEIGLLLVDDAGIADLHEQWLGLAGPTDVITFDLSTPVDPGLHGDIAISVETARRLARELGWQTRHEAAYYAIHGLLHLAGEDDHDPARRRRMRARERAVMAAIGLPRPPRRPLRGGP